MTGTPAAARRCISAAYPCSCKYDKSANVFLDPGNIIMSGFPMGSPCFTNRTDTSGSYANASKSVKLEILGVCITAMVISFATPLYLLSKATESSSSMSKFSMAGTTPTTFFPVFSSIKSKAGCNSVTSPRNLLMMIPFTRSRSSGSSSSNVPTTDAIAPPRSISAMSITGAFASLATRILTISLAFKFTSAGLPAPSMTIISKFSSKYCKLSFTLSKAVNEYFVWYSLALYTPTGFPIKTTCDD